MHVKDARLKVLGTEELFLIRVSCHHYEMMMILVLYCTHYTKYN